MYAAPYYYVSYHESAGVHFFQREGDLQYGVAAGGVAVELGAADRAVL